MALRPDRLVLEADGHSYILNDVASKGMGLVVGTAGSGAVMGDTHGVAALKTDPSGFKFLGILLTDFVNIDETTTHVNWYKEQQVVGDVANILRKGWVYTNEVDSSAPTDGDTAYLTASGVFTKTSLGAAATPQAGVFRGKIDADGFIKIEINLP